MDNRKAYNAPLHPRDTPRQTFGCRHSNPDNCAKNHLDLVCAFVRDDNMCKSPPRSWSTHFQRLDAGIVVPSEVGSG